MRDSTPPRRVAPAPESPERRWHQGPFQPKGSSDEDIGASPPKLTRQEAAAMTAVPPCAEEGSSKGHFNTGAKEFVPSGHQDLGSQAPEFVRPPPGLAAAWGHCAAGPAASDDSGEAGTPPTTTTNHSRRSTAARAARVVQHLHAALLSRDARMWSDKDGFVHITKLVRVRPELQRESFGSTRFIVQAIDAQCPASRSVCLDESRRRVRLQTSKELVQAVAERDCKAAEHGAVTVASIVDSPALRPVLQSMTDATGFVRLALEHEESPVAIHGSWVVRRPMTGQLRQAAEELFSDQHLAQDSKLRLKLADSISGEVPLTWLGSKYSERLGVAPMSGPRGPEAFAAEFCKALGGSSVLLVDDRRLTVRRHVPFQPIAPPVLPGTSGGQAAVRSGRASRSALQLQELLDYYFEPFTLQHNRYLLDLLAKHVGPPEEMGPWVVDTLLGFSCTLDDLMGLRRIAAIVERLGPSLREPSGVGRELPNLRHLAVAADDRLCLQTPMEVRSFVPARGAPPELVSDVTRYLSAAREQRGRAPDGTVSVLSYALAGALADRTPEGLQRQARVKRQLLLHRTDVVCLQGLDPEDGPSGPGWSIAQTLLEEGYTFARARGDAGEANSIFWDRSRWELATSVEHGDALAVDLRPFEDTAALLRIACIRPELPIGPESHLASVLPPEKMTDGTPLLVCADLSMLGGAEGASFVEELAYLPSVAQEVLGKELTTLVAAPRAPSEGKSMEPVRAAASGLNKVHCPDAVLFQGVGPIAALSNHTEGYLVTMAKEDAAQQFPAFRIPIVAAFNWRGPSAGQGSPAAPAGPDRRVRL